MNTTWLAASAVVVQFAVSLVLARNLGPSGKGQVDITVATVNLAVLTLALGLPSGVTYVVAKGASQRHLLLGAVGVSLGAALLALVTLWVIAATRLADAFLPAGSQSPFVLMGIGVGVLALVTLTRSILVGAGKASTAAALEFAGRLTTLAGVIWATSMAHGERDQLSIVLLAMIAGWLLTASSNGAAIARRGTGSGLRVPMLARYSGPSYLGTLVQFANYRADLFIVALLVGTDGVGLYALAVSIAQLTWVPTQSAAQTVLPAAAENPSKVPYAAARRSVLSSWSGAAALLVAGPLLIPLVFGADFADSVLPLLLLIPGICAFALNNIYAAFLGGIGRPALNLRVALVSLAVGLTLDILLIPVVGIAGAAVATTVSYAAATLMSARYYSTHSGRSAREVIPSPTDVVALLNGLRRKSRPAGQ